MAAIPRLRNRSGSVLRPPHTLPALCALAAALLASAIVLVLGFTRPQAPAAPPAPVANAGELRAETGEATWLGMDHNMSPTASGYQMPPAMMPGMPATGEDRLSVAVALENTGGRTVPIDPGAEFTLHAAPGQPGKQVYGTTFGALPRLGPHSVVNGVLFFDLPPADLTPAAWLDWNHQGTVARLTVGPVSPHAHGK